MCYACEKNGYFVTKIVLTDCKEKVPIITTFFMCSGPKNQHWLTPKQTVGN